MQNNPSLRKWTDLRGLAVVSLDTGSKIGTVENFYFNPTLEPIYGLQVKTGMVSHRVLPSNAIKAIGESAVTIADENVLYHEKDDDLSALIPGQNLLFYKVMSAGGTVVGEIGDILLDVSSPSAVRVAAFELKGGLLNRISGHHHTFNVQDVIRYGQDVIVIPDAVAVQIQ